MIALLRLVGGLLVGGLLGAFWLPRAGYVQATIGMPFSGLVAGLLMRSWSSVLLAPGAFLAGMQLACYPCPVGEEETTADVLLGTIFIYALVGLGAVLGTLIAKRLPDLGRRPPTSSRR